MSYLHTDQLSSIRDEYRAARVAVAFMAENFAGVVNPTEPQNIKVAHVDLAFLNIEATYLIRLFSEFEGILRDYLPKSSPSRPDRRNIYSIIDRVASKRRITPGILSDAHQVREHRNELVHH